MQRRIPLALIYGNPDQPRKTFEEAPLRELAASIRENGLKQPPTVRPDDDGRFMLVMGERRFRACQLLDLPDVLCIVSKVDDMQLAVDAIIENDQRVDVAPLEQARSYQRMIEVHGFTPDTLAIKLGKPLRRINERLVLLQLTPQCQQLLSAEQITPTQAWALASLDAAGQGKLLRAINAGQCRSHDQLQAVAAAIREDGATIALFDLPDDGPTDDERRTAAGFEATLDRVATLLRGAIDGNQAVTAVRRVDPGRAGTVADLLAAMSIDIKRLETAFRVAAAGAAITEDA